MGIDRLSISFPVRSIDGDLTRWATRTISQPGTPNERWTLGQPVKAFDGKATVFVGVTEIEGRLFGKVESNPARFYDPYGCNLMPFGMVPQAASVMYLLASTFMDVAHEDPGAARVKRLDVARDFSGVEDPALYVESLRGIHRPYASRSYVYSDPQKNQAQTLWAGNGAGGGRLYDQHEAYGDAKGAPSGSVRTEIEARSDWCSRVGMTRVEDVTVERCEQLLMERWDWTAFGTAVAPGFDVVERVKRYRDEDGDLLSSAVRARLIGHLVEEALGHDPRMSKNTATVYRRLKRRLGVVPSPALLSARTGEPRRLDFYVGTEVSV